MRLWNELHALTWTLAGTGLVLITLSGETRKWGIIITCTAIVVHMVGVLLQGDSDE